MQDLVGKKKKSMGIKVNLLRRMSSPLLGLFRSGCVEERSSSGFLWKISIDLGLLFKNGGRMQKSGIIVIGFVLPLEYLN